MRTCGHCKRETHYYLHRGMCPACYRYWQRHGGEMRPLEQRKQSKGTCRDCRQALAKHNGLCGACYQYRRVNDCKRPSYRYAKACTNCKRPRSDDWIPRHGRCPKCNYHWRKYGVERVAPKVRYCDCGNVATHLDVALQMAAKAERYDLCSDCYQLEMEE